MRAVRGAILIAFAVASAPFGLAASEAGPAPKLAPLESFQRSEDRLFRIGYRLAVANAPFCERTLPVSGMLIHDARSYSQPDGVRALFGLSGDLGVQSVAPGSPAAAAGIAQNDTVLAIEGKDVAVAWPPSDPAWKRAVAIRDALDAALARGAVRITAVAPGKVARTVTIAGVDACTTRFELVDFEGFGRGRRRKSDRRREIPGFFL